MITKKITTIFTVAALAFAGQLSVAEAAAKTPNVILIFTDDMGYADAGCYGAKDISTPNLDRMAAEGVRFTDFYSANAVCSPSRAAMLTGRYPTRCNVPKVLFPRDSHGFPSKEVTIAEILKKAGYATACIGKWHLGHKPEFLPTRQGFDYYLGIPYSNDMWIDKTAPLASDLKLNGGATVDKIRSGAYSKKGGGLTSPHEKFQLPLMLNEEVIEFPVIQTTLTQRYTDEAIKFIKTNANDNKPFFVYLPHAMPHIPLAASNAFRGKSKQGFYGDTIEELDFNVGRLLTTLKELNIDDNTLVIFTSDNGPWLGLGELSGRAKPLKGGKFSTNEGGQRVPMIMRWPGKVAAGRECSQVASMLDLFPTIATLAGQPLPNDRVIDGQHIWPLLALEEGEVPEKDFFYVYGWDVQAVRSGKWKLQEFLGGGAYGLKRKAGQKALYDLESDPGETTNVADKYPEVFKRLEGLIAEKQKEIGTGIKPGGRKEKGAAKLVWPKVKVGDVYASKSAPAVVKKAFKISGEIEVAAEAKQVVLAHGGTAVGYSLYLDRGELVFAVATGKNHIEHVKTPAPAGKFSFEAGLDDKGHLFVQVGDNEAVRSQTGGHWITKWPVEDLSVGFDDGNPVDPKSPKDQFKGKLVKLEVK